MGGGGWLTSHEAMGIWRKCLRLNPWPQLFGCIFKLEVSRSHRQGLSDLNHIDTPVKIDRLGTC